MNDRLDDLLVCGDDAASLAEPLQQEQPIPTTTKSKKQAKTKQKFYALKKKIMGRKVRVVVKKKGDSGNSSGSNTSSSARDVVMKAFQDNMEALQSKIESIGEATKEIETMTEQITFGMLSSKEEKQLDNRISSLVNTTNQTAQTIRTSLRLLQQESKELQEQNPQLAALSESDFRVRYSMLSTTTRKFIDDLRLFQTAQKVYKEKTTKKFKRQIQCVQPNITDEQVESLIQNGQGRDSLWQEMILDNRKVNQRIQSIHNVVSDKHNAILQIEQSVAVVQRMFMELALLTEEQGLLLDRIEHQVHQAADYVEQGNEEVYDAYKFQKRIRRKKLWTLTIAAGITVGVVLILVL